MDQDQDQEQDKQADEKQADAGQPINLAVRHFTQADVDRIVRERLERDRFLREREAGRARAESDAAQQKDWRELEEQAREAEQRNISLQARVGELEPLGKTAERYRQALEKVLLTEKKDLPVHLSVLLEKLDPVEQIEYLAGNRQELGLSARADGVPASPVPKERSLSEEDMEAARRGQAGLYGNF